MPAAPASRQMVETHDVGDVELRPGVAQRGDLVDVDGELGHGGSILQRPPRDVVDQLARATDVADDDFAGELL